MRLHSMALDLGALLKQRSESVAISESSTGGLVCAAMLSVPGASAYFLGCGVIYTGVARSASPDELADPEFFSRENYRAKIKRPFEYVVSALRATGAEIESLAMVQVVLLAMDERIYLCKDPTGYYDQAEAWRDPGAFAVRWKFAHDLVMNKVPGVAVPASLYGGLTPRNVERWKEILVGRLLPGGLGERTSGVIDRMVRAYLARNESLKVAELAPRLAALILGSPEFQQQ